MRHLMIVACICFWASVVFSQDIPRPRYPIVGDAFPEHIFTDLRNYEDKSLNTHDFKGKWVIVDLWAYSCVSCMKSFPKMDSLSKVFGDKVKVVLVGITKFSSQGEYSNTKKYEKITKEIYNRLDQKDHYKMTVAFDSTFALKYDVGAVPQIFIIDPDGIIRAKTFSVDARQIKLMLDGVMPKFSYSYSAAEPKLSRKYNQAIPLLTSGKIENGGTDTSYLFRSLLTLQDDMMPNQMPVNFSENSINLTTGRVEMFHSKIDQLYKAAYFGFNDWYATDSVNYVNYYPLINWDTVSSKYSDQAFSYSLTVPKEKAHKDYLMQIMQSDLLNYFGYSGKVENRDVPVFYIAVADKKKVEKLISKDRNQQKFIDSNIDGMYLKNVNMNDFCRYITNSLDVDIPVFNGTNISQNISIDFRANMVDPKDIESALKKYGLELVKKSRKMQVLIVQNKKRSAI